MDALTSILLYACAAAAVAGALGAAIGPAEFRWLSLLVLTVGTVGVLAALSAGFAALAFLVAGVASAAALAAPAPSVSEDAGGPAPAVRQLGGVVAAALFAVLAYAAFRGSFGHGAYPGGFFNSAAIGRLLLDRDALTGLALGGLLLIAVAGAATSWRRVRR